MADVGPSDLSADDETQSVLEPPVHQNKIPSSGDSTIPSPKSSSSGSISGVGVSQFILKDVDVSGSLASLTESEEGTSCDQTCSSFVNDELIEYTDSQEIRHLRSLREGSESDGTPPVEQNLLNQTVDSDDSFCVENVEYEEGEGQYTQAMKTAKKEVEKEDPALSGRRKTRSEMIKKKRTKDECSKKSYKRIRIPTDSSEESE